MVMEMRRRRPLTSKHTQTHRYGGARGVWVHVVRTAKACSSSCLLC